MSRLLLLLFLTLCGTPLIATPREDAEFFITHFIPAKRMEGAKSYAFDYRSLLSSRGIVTIDHERYSEIVPRVPTDEELELIKDHVSEIIIANYGEENLSQIVDFFQTPLGEDMLTIAKNNELFAKLFYYRPARSPVQEWSSYLTPLERARYGAFTNTPAGKAFVQQTYGFRQTLHFAFYKRTFWPTPSLDQPYMIEVIKADGILKFPNRTARQSLLRELEAASR